MYGWCSVPVIVEWNWLQLFVTGNLLEHVSLRGRKRT